MKNDRLLSIKEFSDFTGVSQSALRYYDDIGLFSPAQRGENGYRYYSPQQTTYINQINIMRKLKVPLEKISDFVKHRTPELIVRALQEKEDELDEEMYQLHEMFSILHVTRNAIVSGMIANENEIELHEQNEHSLFLGPKTNFDSKTNHYFYDPLLVFYEYCRQFGFSLCYPIGGYFDDMDAYVASPSRPTHFFSADPRGTTIKPAGHYMVGYTRGYYGETNDLPERMVDFAVKNNLSFNGPMYNTYLHDEVCISDPSQYLLRASILVKKKHGAR
jgi:DNA-binding transcriptional MerR regulator